MGGQGWRASVQRIDRRVRQDPEVRRYPGHLQRLHHLCCRYLHLPRHVLRYVRYPEAHAHRRKGLFRGCFLPSWMGCHCYCRLMSYPIDTIRRRMMMTSGGGAKYKGSIDCGMQILKNEGFMSMMKGAGANILRGVAGAGVLAGFDKFQA